MQSRKLLASLIAVFVSILASFGSASALPAFPEAEGYGSDTTGGRGGKVFIVRNTNDSGSGSLRECIEADGKRICVFSTGGTISLLSTLTIENPYITIAGQTAPGGGITIKTNGNIGMRIKTHDVVIRFLSIRNGSGGQTQAILVADNGSNDTYNIIVDHCSLSWATDEILTTWYRAHDLTFQWNVISEALDCSTHPKGCHSKGSLLGGYKFSEGGIGSGRGAYGLSIHHNLYAHNGERNPMVKNCGRNDIRNNVVYNPIGNMMHFYISCLDDWGYNQEINYVGNYGKDGPDTSTSGKYLIKHVPDGGDIITKIYVEGNLHRTRPSESDPEANCIYPSSRDYTVETEFNTPAVKTTSAKQAYDDVLAADGAGNSKYLSCSGNWINRRDAHDARIVSDVQSGTEFTGSAGRIIDDESEVGGWLNIETGSACSDTDSDGMPDTWEAFHGLNPNDSSDNKQDSDGDGYTNIEEFLNGSQPGGHDSKAPAPPTGLRIVSQSL